LPAQNPQKENTLMKGELITGITIPKNAFTKNVYYLKIRDRASYAFALVSVAAALDLNGTVIKNTRLAMGGVAHKPWRLNEAEKFLAGKNATRENFMQAAELAMKGAKGYGHNNFKLKMGTIAITEALMKAAG
jgi:xanthine dehydrogenase YagS FAD-binding subunit